MANHKLKLLYILKQLTDESDDQHPISAEQILQNLSEHGIACERKSVYSDIAVLKDFGYDICYTKQPCGGYVLATRHFEPTEIQLLCDAVGSANFISPSKSTQLTEKLVGLLNQNQAEDAKHIAHVKNASKSTNEQIYNHITDLKRAIRDEKKVTVLYRRRVIGNSNAVEYEEREHTVSPYAMIWSDDHYYLVGNNAKYDNLMVLRVDRIRKLSVLEEDARPFSEVSPYTDFFDSADYAHKHFNMFSGTIENIELVCKNELIEPILDRFGEDVHITRFGDDRFILSAEVAVGEGLLAWIMQFGAKIQIRSPETLRSMLTDKIKEIRKAYKI